MNRSGYLASPRRPGQNRRVARALRIALVVHGYPPELFGGTECTVQALARGLARAGHEPLVIAGTDRHAEQRRVSRAEDRDPESGRTFPVYRIHRSDLHYGHWTKSRSPFVGRAFEELLDRERPALVHVHHWVRLTSDLVVRAARRRIPAVVTLHDLSTTCLVYFRVHPSTRAFCEAPLAPDPCVDCAGSVFVPAPWLARADQAAVLERGRADVRRELECARAVLALSHDQARTLERFLGPVAPVRVVPPASGSRLAPVDPLPPPGDGRPLALGCWATLHLLKGTDLLIEAVRLLGERGVPVELHLAGIEGDAAYVAGLREQARGLSVRFHGRFDALTGHAVTRVHAFVGATRAHETWGVVLDEAIGLRLPMVLPRAGAYAERLREGEGALFFEPGDARALAVVLERLWREPALLAELRARIPASETLPRIDDHVRRLVAIYDEVLEAGAPVLGPEDPVQRAADETFLVNWDRECARSR